MVTEIEIPGVFNRIPGFIKAEEDTSTSQTSMKVILLYYCQVCLHNAGMNAFALSMAKEFSTTDTAFSVNHSVCEPHKDDGSLLKLYDIEPEV